MRIGDLVKSHSCGEVVLGIIIEVPEEDDYWGKTAVIQWATGREAYLEPEECEEKDFEVISASR